MTVESNIAIAQAYYEAIRSKDIAGVARLLHPDVQFIGPMAEVSGKDAVRQTVERFAAMIRGLQIRAAFGAGSQAMLAYDVDFGEPIGLCRGAVLMTFQASLIARLELFYDARPFEKNLKKDAIFAAR